MRLRVKVYVTPRDGVLDPQGKAVERSLRSLGFSGVEEVRVGKYLELELEAACRAEAEQSVRSMCERLLANPVIEDYSFEIEEPSALSDRPSADVLPKEAREPGKGAL